MIESRLRNPLPLAGAGAPIGAPGIEGPVAVVDDDSDQARSVADVVASIDLVPLVLPGPFQDLPSLIERVMRDTGALICDHKLSSRGFAEFLGAEAVAELYGRRPAVLLTSYLNTDESIPIRLLRRRIPSVLSRPQLSDPDQLALALHLSLAELQGRIPMDRVPVRTLVRLDLEEWKLGRPTVPVFIESWRPEAVPFPLDLIPRQHLESILRDRWFTANVNTGAEEGTALFFENIEPAPQPVDDV